MDDVTLIETIASACIVVMRIGCILLFGAMLVYSFYKLVYDTVHDNEKREVLLFVIMILTAIEYASVISIYLQAAPDVEETTKLFHGFVISVLFFCPALWGVKVFLPWKVR